MAWRGLFSVCTNWIMKCRHDTNIVSERSPHFKSTYFLNFFIAALWHVTCDSPNRSFSIAAGHMDPNPAAVARRQASAVFYAHQTSPGANVSVSVCAAREITVTSRSDPTPCCRTISPKNPIFHFLLNPSINPSVILVSCGKHLWRSLLTWTEHVPSFKIFILSYSTASFTVRTLLPVSLACASHTHTHPVRNKHARETHTHTPTSSPLSFQLPL